MTADMVEPKDGVTPKPTAKDADGDGLPDELLQIPAMQALFAGSPPAVSTSLKDFSKRPEAKIIEQSKDAIQKAGIGLYRSLDGSLGVLFNQLRIAGQDLMQADKEGRLLEVAPPFDQVSQSISASGDQNPVLSAEVPGGAKTPGVPPPSPMPAPAPASVQNKITTARLQNIPPGSPTSGPAPGAGRILNNILKPVV